jgi:hypothetical protein
MDGRAQRQKGWDSVLSMLNVVIEALSLTKEVSSITPAKAAFGPVSVLLIMIRVHFLPHHDPCKCCIRWGHRLVRCTHCLNSVVMKLTHIKGTG